MYARYKAKMSKGVYSLGSKQSVEQTDLRTDGYTSHSNQETIHGKHTTDEVVSNDFYIKMQIFLNEKTTTEIHPWMDGCMHASKQPSKYEKYPIIWIR